MAQRTTACKTRVALAVARMTDTIINWLIYAASVTGCVLAVFLIHSFGPLPPLLNAATRARIIARYPSLVWLWFSSYAIISLAAVSIGLKKHDSFAKAFIFACALIVLAIGAKPIFTKHERILKVTSYCCLLVIFALAILHHDL
jgi:hypothetical protein